MASRKTVLVVNLVLTLFFVANAAAIWGGMSIYPQEWRFVFGGGIVDSGVGECCRAWRRILRLYEFSGGSHG